MSRSVVMAGWEDVPHISPAERERLLAATPPWQREARSRGIPQLGAGAIYPIPLADITVPDFEIPRHFPRGYAMDFGWKATAALWGAWDRAEGKDIIYLTREYKRGQAEPEVHASAIKRGSEGMTGAADPASRGRSQKDGSRLMDIYSDLGLQLIMANNRVEAGLFEVWLRMTTGRLKIFNSLALTIAEARLYRRDDKGRIVKENDHLMDCLRYLVATADHVLTWTADPPAVARRGSRIQGMGEQAGWMAR